MQLTATASFLLLGIGAVLAAPELNTLKDSCDFSDLDLDSMVEAVVKKLPSEYLNPDVKLDKAIPGFTFGRLAYTGLDKLKPYGPVLPYCRGGSRLVQVDLVDGEHELQASMPWEYCGGQNGEVGSRAAGRLTVTFKVDDSDGKSGARLVHHSRPKVVSMEKTSLYIYGAGNVVEGLFAASNMLFPALTQAFWQEFLTHRLGAILKEMS